MRFDMESVVNSYRWLGHGGAWTEVNAYHPMYRPGRENYAYNRRYGYFPVVRYVRGEERLLNLVRKFHGSRMVCYGINPRQGVKTYPSGHPRAHKDQEIGEVKNFYIDFDLERGASQEQAACLELLLEEVMGKVENMGFGMPVKAFTGNGFHLLFAIPGIKRAECPDIKERIRDFRERLVRGFSRKLASIPAKVDSTDDLSRMAKVYGTGKPGRSALSCFHGDGTRREDGGLQEHLINTEPYRSRPGKGMGLEKVMELPEVFSRLLKDDEKVKNLWLGTGKTSGDLSRSGYDYSLLRECMARGMTDVRALAAVLALRPGGPVKDGYKGEQYIRATIARAVKDFQWGID